MNERSVESKNTILKDFRSSVWLLPANAKEREKISSSMSTVIVLIFEGCYLPLKRVWKQFRLTELEEGWLHAHTSQALPKSEADSRD